jgi:hypothetical protein
LPWLQNLAYYAFIDFKIYIEALAPRCADTVVRKSMVKKAAPNEGVKKATSKKAAPRKGYPGRRLHLTTSHPLYLVPPQPRKVPKMLKTRMVRYLIHALCLKGSILGRHGETDVTQSTDKP